MKLTQIQIQIFITISNTNTDLFSYYSSGGDEESWGGYAYGFKKDRFSLQDASWTFGGFTDDHFIIILIQCSILREAEAHGPHFELDWRASCLAPCGVHVVLGPAHRFMLPLVVYVNKRPFNVLLHRTRVEQSSRHNQLLNWFSRWIKTSSSQAPQRK